MEFRITCRVFSGRFRLSLVVMGCRYPTPKYMAFDFGKISPGAKTTDNTTALFQHAQLSRNTALTSYITRLVVRSVLYLTNPPFFVSPYRRPHLRFWHRTRAVSESSASLINFQTRAGLYLYLLDSRKGSMSSDQHARHISMTIITRPIFAPWLRHQRKINRRKFPYRRNCTKPHGKGTTA